MTQTITGHFDGKVIVPDRPVKLPVGKRLRIQIDVAASGNGKKPGKTRRKPTKSLEIIGTGMFDSGIPDLATNKKYMEGFGKS
ncbi:MAG: hypothetical protein L0Y72_11595 [Gemmataceae bacterium]|nr:hypothetical protein [Gemmataceae bacterium]MCI0739681.1 hypothetical protein [Gemmataceae bacterium]